MKKLSKASRVVCLGVLILAGCDPAASEVAAPPPATKAKPTDVSSGDVAAPAEKKLEPAERAVGGMKFVIPSDWEEQPLSSSFVLGEFSLPGTDGPGRLTMSTAGGGTTANIDRWKGQFRRGPGDAEPKESQIIVAGKVATLVEAYGTFTDMFDKREKSNWQILGVAIPIDADHNYFVKLTGPQQTLTARRDEFIKFLESARFE